MYLEIQFVYAPFDMPIVGVFKVIDGNDTSTRIMHNGEVVSVSNSNIIAMREVK